MKQLLLKSPSRQVQTTAPSRGREMRAGLETALQTFPNSIGPLLLFGSVFGPVGVFAGFWAALVTASVVRAAALALRGNSAIVPCSRMASLATLVALVLQFAKVSAGGSAVDGQALRFGLTAAGVLFLFASALIMIAGLLRWGQVFKMIPTPVLSGIATGTALALLYRCTQMLGSNGGLDAVVAGAMGLVFLAWPLWTSRPAWLSAFSPALLASMVGIALVWLVVPSVPPAQRLPPETWSQALLLTNLPHVLTPEFPRLLLLGLPGALTLALVMVLETFSTVGQMESRHGAKVDANRELVALGGSNIVSALLGGVPSTGTASGSAANHAAGGRGPMAIAACLLVATVVLVTFSPWLRAMPVGLTAGFLLMNAAMTADKRWLSQAWGKLRQPRRTRLDQAFWLSAVIGIAAFAGGLTWAAFLGLSLSTLIVLRRLAHRLTARWEDLRQHRSRRIRHAEELAVLDHSLQAVNVLRLTGHLFFGNSVRLGQLADEVHPLTIAAVIDVTGVVDADTSGCDAMRVLMTDLRRRRLDVVLCGLHQCKSSELRRTLTEECTGLGLRTALDLDRALEDCEDHVLRSAGASATVSDAPLEANGLLYGLSPDQARAVLSHGRLREVPQGRPLFQRDEPADDLWLIESGRVSVVTQQDQDSQRLATFGPGQFVGEMAFLDGRPRSATALADTTVRALQLDVKAFALLRHAHPETALAVALNLARELSLRVRASNLRMQASDTSE